jgi:hypothetical protein
MLNFGIFLVASSIQYPPFFSFRHKNSLNYSHAKKLFQNCMAQPDEI